MTIHIEVSDIGEKTLVVYEPKKMVSFFRPLFGIELEMDNQVLLNRVRTRVKKWERANALAKKMPSA
jgi:hypothetical protein